MSGVSGLRLAMTLVVVVGGIVLVGTAGPANAAVFNVNTTADTPDANPGNGVCADASGHCSLRAAVEQANALGGVHTVNLPGNATYPIGSQLIVDEDITIHGGAGSKPILNGGGADPVLHIGSSGALTADKLDIRNGAGTLGGNIYVSVGRHLHLSDCLVTGGSAAECGGGIYSDGTVTLEYTNVEDNQSTGFGGGICGRFPGSLYLFHCIITGNTSGEDGGGIFFQGNLSPYPYLTVLNSTVGSNQAATGRGGGISTWRVNFTARYSTFTGNSASEGGGIYHFDDGTLTIESCAVTGNSAWDGGGLYYNTSFSADKALQVVNSTFSGNTADNNGGGVYFLRGTPADLSSCTIADNTADADADGDGDGGGVYSDTPGLVIRNSLIAANDDLAPGMFDPFGPDCAGEIESAGYNLIGLDNGLCTLSGDTASNITGYVYPGLDPRIAALEPCGYGTEHHPLLESSRAVNAGNPAGCVDHNGDLITEDQCLEYRHQSAACDIGAAESSFVGGLLFYDGFESHNTAAWSSATP